MLSSSSSSRLYCDSDRWSSEPVMVSSFRRSCCSLSFLRARSLMCWFFWALTWVLACSFILSRSSWLLGFMELGGSTSCSSLYTLLPGASVKCMWVVWLVWGKLFKVRLSEVQDMLLKGMTHLDQRMGSCSFHRVQSLCCGCLTEGHQQVCLGLKLREEEFSLLTNALDWGLCTGCVKVLWKTSLSPSGRSGMNVVSLYCEGRTSMPDSSAGSEYCGTLLRTLIQQRHQFTHLSVMVQ